MNFTLLLLIHFLFLTQSVSETRPEIALGIPDHAPWSAELFKYVSHDGLIDYKAWKENQEPLDHYLKELSGDLPLSRWSQNVQLAYWLNIHNAYSIKQVLAHYPMASIREIDEGNARKTEWIVLDTAVFSLEEIEQHILYQFKDPRIFFALHYAAVSGAPLLNEAYEPHRIHDQLDDQVRHFLSDSTRNQINDSSVVLSPVIEWHASTFKPDIHSFLNRYLEKPLPNGTEFDYFEFDWSIDEQPEESVDK